MHVRARQDQLRHLHSSEGTVAHAQVRWIIHFSAPEADSLMSHLLLYFHQEQEVRSDLLP